MKDVKRSLVEKYATDNQNAAEIILRNVQKYGGDGAGLVIWARAVVAGERRTRADWGLAA